jgi:hypothetical protein
MYGVGERNTRKERYVKRIGKQKQDSQRVGIDHLSRGVAITWWSDRLRQ